MNLLDRLSQPRWAVVVYQDGDRICVLDCFIFRASATSYADTLNNVSRTVYPRTRHAVERIYRRPDPGERCVQA